MEKCPKLKRVFTLPFEVFAFRITLQNMLRLRAIASFAVLLLLAAGGGGCIPADNHVDEEKDPHFQRGRNLVESQDFKGAVDEFEKALETNPHSAAAHFELGWLDENKLNDYAAAIYHYERYLELQPNSERSQSIDVKERIRGCKQQLANSEFPLPNTQNLQREVDRLTAENLLLHQQLDALRAQGGKASVTSERATAPRMAIVSTVPHDDAGAAPSTASMPHRTHVVRSRETLSSIAAQYGVKVSAILEANPGIEPRRLRVGQSLNLP